MRYRLNTTKPPSDILKVAKTKQEDEFNNNFHASKIEYQPSNISYNKNLLNDSPHPNITSQRSLPSTKSILKLYHALHRPLFKHIICNLI